MGFALHLPPNGWLDNSVNYGKYGREPKQAGAPAAPQPQQEGNNMGYAPGYALWCDQHGGAFSPKDPDMQEYSRKAKVGNTDYDVETFTLCGPCANGFQVGQPTVTALEAKIAAAEQTPQNDGGTN